MKLIKNNILFAEDEESIQEIVQINLKLEGYDVKIISDGSLVLDEFRRHRYDLVILDVMLPNKDGFQICQEIRRIDEAVPIMFLSARDSSSEKVHGLKLGADDYLGKPFHREEFLLRVKSLLKRNEKVLEFCFAGNKINFSEFKAENWAGDTWKLSAKEIAMLQLLIEKRNQVVPRGEILDRVWGKDVFLTSRSIDNFIVNFRKKFERDPKNPQVFKSVRGVGYVFELKE
ncbi:MAG: response regulator transcription factor [Flavobacteriales bacterium]|nr:response regulator transcription factor [Flavobacteriales bacterium]